MKKKMSSLDLLILFFKAWQAFRKEKKVILIVYKGVTELRVSNFVKAPQCMEGLKSWIQKL